MGAEMTATMIVWPTRCGRGGVVLELVEHFRPNWLGWREGRRISATVPKPGRALRAGLMLARPALRNSTPRPGFASWSGQRVTVLRYRGCVLGDGEFESAREAGVHIEVVDLDGGRIERSA